jgi:hypothetical protein
MSNPKLDHAAMTAAAVMSFLMLAGVPADAAAPLPSVHVRGTVTLALGPKTTIAEAFPASGSDIKPNSFLGMPNVPGPNNAQAVGVLPEALRNAPANAGWDWPVSGGLAREST